MPHPSPTHLPQIHNPRNNRIGVRLSLILRNTNAASTTANSKLNIALIGCGGQGRTDMRNIVNAGANLVALCDVDQAAIATARGESHKSAKSYTDYRKLLEDSATFDAVIIATPDHWHAPLATAFMKAGKHIYGEKPLTHSIAEARDLRELSRNSKVITQMGNQGSGTASLRRCTEIVQAGAIGQVKEIYVWGLGCDASEGNAEGEDPIPANFDWDFWVGPSAMRPYKKDVYHPFKWRHWFDFGNSELADIWCHSINLAMRSLKLAYPTKIVVNLENGKPVGDKSAVEFQFPAREGLEPLVIHWHGRTKPPEHVLKHHREVFGDKGRGGVMVLGDKGTIFTDYWNQGGMLKLQGEPRLTDILHHAATKSIPQTLPRVKSHQDEFVAACRGEGQTFSPFDFGGHLTEIGLAGVAAIRAGHSIAWDGEKMESPDTPEIAKFIRTEWRSKWIG